MTGALQPPPVAVVSGANRGLGLELCRQLQQRGWHVVALCRSSSPELDALSEASNGVQIVPGIDVGDDACVALLQQHLAGVPVGLLICNAAILSVDSVAELDSAIIRQQFEVNALGPLRVAHALRSNLAPSAKLAFITSKMGSIAATQEGGKNGSVGYRMSKAAANMAGQLLALELRPSSIPVVLIHPGAVTTDMYHSYWAAVGRGSIDGSGSSGSGSGAATNLSRSGNCASTAAEASGAASRGGMAPSAHGPISVQEAAAGVLRRIDELSLHTTGQFVQAATGEVLPW